MINFVEGTRFTDAKRAQQGPGIGELAGRHLKKCVLELGGSDPFIVLDDADLARTVPVAVASRFGNAGQTCIAAKRFIVVEAVADRFIQAFAEAASALRTGDPNDEATTLAPMARADLRDELPRIALPALVIAGEHDRLTPPGAGRELAARLPTARFRCGRSRTSAAPPPNWSFPAGRTSAWLKLRPSSLLAVIRPPRVLRAAAAPSPPAAR